MRHDKRKTAAVCAGHDRIIIHHIFPVVVLCAGVQNVRVTPTTHPDAAQVVTDQLRAFGENLRCARKRAELNKAAVARAAEVLDYSAISKIEQGERAPNFLTLLRVAKVVGTTSEQLLENIGPPSVPPLMEPLDGRLRRDPGARFTANLIALRERAGLSQEELALNAPIDRSLMSNYETGVRQPNLRSLLKLAAALNVSPAALMHGVR